MIMNEDDGGDVANLKKKKSSTWHQSVDLSLRVGPNLHWRDPCQF